MKNYTPIHLKKIIISHSIEILNLKPGFASPFAMHFYNTFRKLQVYIFQIRVRGKRL
jgi:hypothetical protein